MKRLSTVLFILLFVTFSHAQQTWQRTYGGTNDEYGQSVQQTADGGYIVTGGTYSFGAGNGDVWLVKTNASGDTLWTRTYGGTDWDEGYSVQQTSDGGYIVAGTTYSFGAGYEDVYLIKTNASGDTLWTRTYGGAVFDYGYSVRQTTDGGYIVAGSTSSFGNGNQVYLIKTNALGDTLWTRNYGEAGDDYGRSVQQTTDGGYIVAGSTSSFGNSYQVYLIKTNASGDTLWTKTYGGTSEDWGFSIQQTSDTGCVVAGWTTSFGNNSQIYLIKVNAFGDTLMTRTYGGLDWDQGFSVQQTSDRDYIVAGSSDSFGDSSQVYLIKTNASGDTLWTRTCGGAGNDGASSVQQTSDGGYIIAGTTGSFGNGWQIYLIKTDANGNVGVEVSPSHQSRVTGYGVFPNPFTSFASVPGHSSERFALYDISGRKIGTYKGDRIGEGLAAGVYFLKPEGREGKPVRVVKVR